MLYDMNQYVYPIYIICIHVCILNILCLRIYLLSIKAKGAILYMLQSLEIVGEYSGVTIVQEEDSKN